MGIYLKDNTTDFSVLVDRALGGSSIVDGEIELMLHRYIMSRAKKISLGVPRFLSKHGIAGFNLCIIELGASVK